ncbi:MAG: hypothetical protein IJ048_13160 [Clostridia bacterium]|nr:hypothetical protein [Clostridia bacterium]
MNQYLTPEQRAAFEAQLADDALTDEERQEAFQQGADMAQADLSREAEPAAEADAVTRSGFDSVEALLAAYEQSQAALRQAEDALAQMAALSRALENGNRLEEADPEARNRRVQDAWKRRADLMRDLEALLPDMAAYILAHPEHAVKEDGLERAYDAVRSEKYRSDEELLDDPESVKRFAADPRVKNAVLTAHLAQVYRAGQALPAFIAGGGSIPGEAAHPQAGMEQAKAKLEALLKQN